MKICPNCEERIPDKATMCPHCGEDFEKTQPVIVYGEQEQTQLNSLILIVAAVLILGCALVLFFLVWRTY